MTPSARPHRHRTPTSRDARSLCRHTPLTISFRSPNGPIVRHACGECGWSYWELDGHQLPRNTAAALVDVSGRAP